MTRRMQPWTDSPGRKTFTGDRSILNNKGEDRWMTSVTAERSESVWPRLVYNNNDQLMVARCAISVKESVALG